MSVAIQEQIVRPDGRVELLPEVDAALDGSRLHNEDLAPVPIAEADLDHLQLPGPVGRHGDQHPDVGCWPPA